jgi:hypothetical protein
MSESAATPAARPIDNVLGHLQGVRRSGAGWVARCPHHEDKQASLSVKEGDGGTVLLHCFAGCGTADVVVSAGLAFVDLFPPGSRERLKPRVWMGVIPMNSNGRPALASFGDDRVAALLAELARLAHVRGRLDERIAGAMRIVGAAVGVSEERLREAVREALATEAT